MLLTCMFTSISSEGPEEKCLASAAPMYQSFLLTCEVWSETVVIVMKETVQQLADVVRRLVGQQAAGDLVLLPGAWAGLLLAEKIENK